MANGFDLETFSYVVDAATGCSVKASARKPRKDPRQNTCGCGGLLGNIKAMFGLSFAPDTPVATPDGPVAISELKVGDLVIARNEDTQISGVFPVTQVFSRVSEEILWVTLQDFAGTETRIGITPEHPLFEAGGDWTEIGDLSVGDLVLDGDLNELLIVAIEREGKHQTVFNLEVEGAHTYYAGDLQVWAHNARAFRGNLRALVMSKNGGCCVRCGAPAAHADHIWPFVRGGPTTLANGQPLCAPCNLRKSCSLPIKGVDLPWKL